MPVGEKAGDNEKTKAKPSGTTPATPPIAPSNMVVPPFEEAKSVEFGPKANPHIEDYVKEGIPAHPKNTGMPEKILDSSLGDAVSKTHIFPKDKKANENGQTIYHEGKPEGSTA